jgi:hypothetical protein
MSEKTEVRLGGASPEEIAFKLLMLVAKTERRSMEGYKQADLNEGWTEANRKWILDTYNECIEAAKGYRGKPKQWPSESGQ